MLLAHGAPLLLALLVGLLLGLIVAGLLGNRAGAACETPQGRGATCYRGCSCWAHSPWAPS